MIAKLLSLSLIDDKKEIKETVSECLKIVGLKLEDLPENTEILDRIADEQVLGLLSQVLSVYLSVEKDEKAACFYGLITERLKNSSYMVIDYLDRNDLSEEVNTTKYEH